MSFILPVNARSFFGFEGQRAFARSRTPKRESAVRFLMFDAFYCCMLLGLDQAKLGDESRLEPANFTVGYPEAYKGQAELIAGLLVDAEIRRLGIGSLKIERTSSGKWSICLTCPLPRASVSTATSCSIAMRSPVSSGCGPR